MTSKDLDGTSTNAPLPGVSGLRRDQGGDSEEDPTPHGGRGAALGAATGRSPFGPGAATIAALCALRDGSPSPMAAGVMGQSRPAEGGGRGDDGPEGEGSKQPSSESDSSAGSARDNVGDNVGDILGSMTFATSIRRSSTLSHMRAAGRSRTPASRDQVNTTSRDILGSMALRRSSGLSRGSGNPSFATGTDTTTGGVLTSDILKNMTFASSMKPSSATNDLLGRKASIQSALPALAAGGSTTGNGSNAGNVGVVPNTMAFNPSIRRSSTFSARGDRGSSLSQSIPEPGRQVHACTTGCATKPEDAGDVPGEMTFAPSVRRSSLSHSNMGSLGFAAGGQANTHTTSFASSIRRSSGLSHSNVRRAGRSANGLNVLPSSSTNSLLGGGSHNVPSLASSIVSGSVSSALSGLPAARPSFSRPSVRRSSTLSARPGRSLSTHDALGREAYASSIKRSFDILHDNMDLIRERNRADDISESLFFAGAGSHANAEWDREAVDGLVEFANKFIVQPSERRKRRVPPKKRR